MYVLVEMMQSLAQRPAPANTNRERRPRYQHPKGAPNADLIFKTGGRSDSNTVTENRLKSSFSVSLTHDCSVGDADDVRMST